MNERRIAENYGTKWACEGEREIFGFEELEALKAFKAKKFNACCKFFFATISLECGGTKSTNQMSFKNLSLDGNEISKLGNHLVIVCVLHHSQTASP